MREVARADHRAAKVAGGDGFRVLGSCVAESVLCRGLAAVMDVFLNTIQTRGLAHRFSRISCTKYKDPWGLLRLGSARWLG